MMNRRSFLDKTAKAGACALLGTALLSQAGCTTYPLVKFKTEEKLLKVALSHFAETKRILVRTPQLEFDIFVHQYQQNQFRATLLQCTHRAEPISISDTRLFCPSHGSEFAMDGAVTKAPAKESLRHYPIELSEDKQFLLINIA
jgi:cytochrome b6-f complex iron-sulfur subunit